MSDTQAEKEFRASITEWAYLNALDRLNHAVEENALHRDADIDLDRVEQYAKQLKQERDEAYKQQDILIKNYNEIEAKLETALSGVGNVGRL